MMKKYFCLAMALFSVFSLLIAPSCSEADQNASNLIGNWKVVRKSVVVNGVTVTVTFNDCQKDNQWIFYPDKTYQEIDACSNDTVVGTVTLSATKMYMASDSIAPNGNIYTIQTEITIKKLTNKEMELYFFDGSDKIYVTASYVKR